MYQVTILAQHMSSLWMGWTTRAITSLDIFINTISLRCLMEQKYLDLNAHAWPDLESPRDTEQS